MLIMATSTFALFAQVRAMKNIISHLATLPVLIPNARQGSQIPPPGEHT